MSPERRARLLSPAVPSALAVELARPLLLTRLNAGPEQFVFLVAPSGYGKTTLMAQWARARNGPVAWLTVTPDDQDPDTLLDSLADAVRSSSPEAHTWEPGMVGATRTQRLRALAQALPSGLDLVIDEGQLLGMEAAALLGQFLQRLGADHRVMVGQHDGGYLSAAPLVASGRALVLGADSLVFLPFETAELSRTVSSPNEWQLEQIQDEQQGWPIGVALALRQPPQTHLAAPLQLVEGLVAQLPAELRATVAQLAPLDEWSEEEARQAGLPLPAGWLRELLRVGMPLTVHDGFSVPHGVVRAYLDRELLLQPERYRALHAAQAERQRQTHPYRAIRHHQLAGQLQSAIDLAESLLPRWRQAADWRLVETVLSPLPAEQLPSSLRGIQALALLETSQTAQAGTLLSSVSQDDPTPLICLARATLDQRSGRLSDALAQTERGLGSVPEDADLIQLLVVKAGVEGRLGQTDQALLDAQDAVLRADLNGQPALRIGALSSLGSVHSLRGDPEDAARAYGLAVALALKTGYVNRVLNGVYYLKTLHLLSGRYDAADRLVGDYLREARLTAPTAVPWGEASLGHLRFVQGQLPEARSLLEASFETFYRQGNYMAASAAFNSLLDLLLETGDVEAARQYWQQLYSALPASDEWEEVNRLNTEALLMHADGAYTQAATLTDRAIQLAATLSDVKLFQTELLRAELHRQAGTLTLDDLLALSRMYQADPDYYVDALQTARIVEALQAHSRDRRWQIPMFSQFGARRDQERRKLPERPRLYLETIGQARVLLGQDELPLQSSAHVEILAYLVLQGSSGEPLNQDTLAQAVWPGQDLKTARHNLQTARAAINRAARSLRARLELIVSGGRGRANAPWSISATLDVTCDAADLLNSSDAEQVGNGHGTFLPLRTSEWVQDVRVQLESHLVRVLLREAEEPEPEPEQPEAVLRRLIRGAERTQNPELVLALRAFAAQHQLAHLSASVEHALHLAQQGEVVRLSHLLN